MKKWMACVFTFSALLALACFPVSANSGGEQGGSPKTDVTIFIDSPGH